LNRSEKRGGLSRKKKAAVLYSNKEAWSITRQTRKGKEADREAERGTSKIRRKKHHRGGDQGKRITDTARDKSRSAFC